MLLAKVIGNVWSTKKEERLVGLKLLVVRPINMLNESELVMPIVAADSVGAGVGETVLIVKGSSARSALINMNIPVDATVVSIVDDMEVNL